MISGVLYMGVVFLVIWAKEEQGQSVYPVAGPTSPPHACYPVLTLGGVTHLLGGHPFDYSLVSSGSCSQLAE